MEVHRGVRRGAQRCVEGCVEVHRGVHGGAGRCAEVPSNHRFSG